MKNIFFIPAAFFLSFLIFVALSFGISKNQLGKKDKDDYIVINFSQTLEDTEVRRKLKKPEIKKPVEQQIKTNVNEISSQSSAASISPLNLNLSSAIDTNAMAVSMSPSLIDKAVMPIVRIPPTYPRRAKILRKQGYVVLEILIDKEGNVVKAQAIEAEPKGLFEEAAIASVLRWKFSPKKVDGKAVSQVATQTIEFQLK